MTEAVTRRCISLNKIEITMDVAIMELNRNPEYYFTTVELAAFSLSNIVPGIGFSPDKMLQARIFSYADAHRYRND